MFVTKLKQIFQKLSHIFNSVSTSAEIKLDAFIFSRQKQPQVRALISGTGLYVTIPFEQLSGSDNFLHRFSVGDREIINDVIRNTTDSFSHLIEGRNIKVIAKTVDRITKKTALKISVADYYNKNIEFQVDPTELSRNKFLLQLFNKIDLFNIGYSAAENRIRTEQFEINKAKNSIQHIS